VLTLHVDRYKATLISLPDQAANAEDRYDIFGGKPFYASPFITILPPPGELTEAQRAFVATADQFITTEPFDKAGLLEAVKHFEPVAPEPDPEADADDDARRVHEHMARKAAASAATPRVKDTAPLEVTTPECPDVPALRREEQVRAIHAVLAGEPGLTRETLVARCMTTETFKTYRGDNTVRWLVNQLVKHGIIRTR